MEKKKQREESLSNYIYKGGKVFRPQNKAIFIFGDTRVGKSTFFNWVRGIRLRGVKIKYETCYVTSYDDAVQSKRSFESVTTIPNTDQINVDGKLIRIYDFAGFHDEGRDYAEVFTVSLMIKQSLNHIQNARFILVCQTHSLLLGQMNHRIQPFKHFVRMFSKDLINGDEYEEDKETQEEVKKVEESVKEQQLNSEQNYEFKEPENVKETFRKLLHSVVLVINKADRSKEEYLDRLSEMAQFLTNSSQNNNQYRLISKFLKNIVKNQRIYLFEQAQINSFAPTCTMFEDMNQAEKKWHYFPWKKNQKKIKLPFQKQFVALPETKVENFKREIYFRLEIFQESCAILNDSTFKIIQYLKDDEIEFKQIFESMKNLVQKFNNYETIDYDLINKRRKKEVGNCFSKLKKFQLLSESHEIIKKKILSLYHQDGENYLKNIDKCQKEFSRIFESFRDILCQSKNQDTLFSEFAFLFLQALKQFGSIYSIKQQYGADALQTLQDSLNREIDQPAFFKARYDFLLHYKPSTYDQCEGIIAEVISLRKEISEIMASEGDQQINKISQKKYQLLGRKVVEVYIQQADHKINMRKNCEAIWILLEAWKYVSKQPKKFQNAKFLQEYLQYFTYRIFSKLGELLLQMNLSDLARKIFQKLKFIDKMDICYKNSYEKEKDKQTKFNKMLEYGNFCEKYARIQDAIKLYQRMYDQFYCFYPTQKKKMIQCIRKCLIKQKMGQFSEYEELLDKYEEEEEIEIPNNLIDQIRSQTQNYEENHVTSKNLSSQLNQKYRSEYSIFEQKCRQKFLRSQNPQQISEEVLPGKWNDLE